MPYIDYSVRPDGSICFAMFGPDKNKRRLNWLHEGDMKDKGGYEWGVFRVKWENGKAVDVLQTLSDFSDLDKAIEAEMEQQKP